MHRVAPFAILGVAGGIVLAGAVVMPIWSRSEAAGARRLLSTERDLGASEQRFTAALEHAPIGIAPIRPDGTSLSMEPTMCRLAGHSREELEGSSRRDLTHPDDLSATDAAVAAALARDTDGYDLAGR